MSTTGRNASDVGLIVQGTLIFLSAVVAVLGYLVQSKLKRKEEKLASERQHDAEIRQLKLARIRRKIDEFIGPALMATITFHDVYYQAFGPQGFTPRATAVGNEAEGKYANTLDKQLNGKITEYWKSKGWNMIDVYKGKMNLLPTFVGEEVEELIRKNPESKISRFYFRHCRRLVEHGKLCSDILVKYCVQLSEYLPHTEFKEKFPCAKDSVIQRNTFAMQFVTFINEFDYIINIDWDKNNDYSVLYPTINHYPMQLGLYIANMLARITKTENELGLIDTHNLMSDGGADATKNLKRLQGGMKEKSNKYVTPGSKKDTTNTSV